MISKAINNLIYNQRFTKMTLVYSQKLFYTSQGSFYKSLGAENDAANQISSARQASKIIEV